MVKVIIQMDGEQDKVLSGEFANVMTASDIHLSDAVTGIIPLFCRGQALDVLILDGVTQFCSIGKNRCALQRKGQLSKDGKQFFSLS